MTEGRRDNHPGRAELDRFLLGEMSHREAAPVISHLLSGCPRCREAMLPLASAVFAKSTVFPTAEPALDSEYDSALLKAFSTARQYIPLAARAKAPAVRDTAPQSARKAAAPIGGWARWEALFELCRELRYSDPERMALAASFAVTLTEKAVLPTLTPAELADLQARAWAELGNAYRITDDLAAAESAFRHALTFSSQGSGDPLLLARLMDLTASLYTDQRRFEEARRLLDLVHAVYEQQGDSQAAARTLISMGVSANYALDSEAAIGFLSDGLRQIDPAHDPKLVLAAVHGLLWCLVEVGRAAEARELLAESYPLYEAHGQHFDQLKRIWLEGRIATQLGDDESAERAFQQVGDEYREADLAYDFALVSLDLAALWVGQKRTPEVRGLVDEIITILRARNIQREALGALLMLRKAVDADQATAALLQTVAAQL
ncbi:MAG TPA: tetratricopeptide repeat protein, partial [Solirubrobacterales bacterium]|nr:tetratricopeptide repeat protein [Solirubrobacterales bacterium]